jgi:2-amino-4-hydroxy-6-hydroxymethyldihydropteridine diphosphokinase
MNTEPAKQKTAEPIKVYVGLGSNLEQPLLQIKKAISALNDLPGSRVLADSGFFASKPMGPQDQPDFINAVVVLETTLSADELLNYCQLIESRQGRIKTRRWGERSIDLDILLYGNQQIMTGDLTVPHPGICERDFVYLPLLKLDPEILIPGAGLLSNIVESATASGSDHACHFAGDIVR